MIAVLNFFFLSLISQSALAQALTFDQAITATLSASSRIKVAEYAMQAQVEKRRGAWANIGPRVSLGYNDVHFDKQQTARLLVAIQDGAGVYRDILLRDDRSTTGSVTVAQPLTGLFPLIAAAQNEGTLEELKNFELGRAQQDATFQTGESYLRAIAAKRLLVIAETSVAAAQSSLKDATALERAGRINRGDVLKLELAVSEARARVAQARAGADIALIALRESMGLSSNTQLVLPDQLPEGNIPPIPPLEEAEQRALQTRPDIQQARLGKDLAAFGQKVAYSQFAPSVNAFVKYDRNFGELGGFGGGERHTRTYGITATWDIWNNGASVFSTRQAAEETARAEAAIKAAEEGVRLDVFQSIANLRAAQESLVLAQTAVKQAEEAYRIEQARFRSGARSATDVILAESSQAGARGRLVTAVSDLIVWNLRLQKALGASRPTL